MGETMNYPENPIDFIKQYSFSDKQQIYTNGSELISVFRVGQMIEHYMSDLTPQQIKDMQFCLREKSRECGELRKEIQNLKNKENDGWSPVEERLPEVGEYVLGTNKYDEVLIYRYGWNSPHTRKMFFHLCGAAATIIAWRPLPDPYRPEGK
ncbi:MAG TPA: DUF551 domain-containing protein [Candidatus Blautia excrementipullorum]|nr:DUF551 domain-containing protein [Candidatus Blautia excrementipullorum]